MLYAFVPYPRKSMGYYVERVLERRSYLVSSAAAHYRRVSGSGLGLVTVQRSVHCYVEQAWAEAG